jgi:glycosidase
MKNPKLQILLQGKGIGLSSVSMTPYTGISLTEVRKVSSPNYLFVYLTIGAEAKPGLVAFKVEGKASTSFRYELKARDNKLKAQGYTNADVLYLMMPDRFANGNPSNDSIKGMLEAGAKRKIERGRHGGDLEGAIQNLDYFNRLGVTALWHTPVQENDMPHASFHGYAITDYYAVDKRFGGNAVFIDYVQKAHAKGLKVVMDMVMNHMGTNHYWFKDMPDSSFINFWPTYTRSNFRATAVADPYASDFDKKQMVKGWFDKAMGDINEANPLVADYMIQNCIWWIEHGCIDDIRMDTYPYPDTYFMNQWATRITDEYPKLNLVGETMCDEPYLVAYFVKNHKNFNGFNSTGPSAFDFPLKKGILDGFNDDKVDYSHGLVKIYNTLAADFVYETPARNTTLLNNHDLTRVLTALKGNVNKNKMALAILLTTRGTPQLYYGEEWAMTGDVKNDADVRKDFAGGWAGDSSNFFTNKNISATQQDMFNYYQRLLQWRKTSTVIHNGRLTQFVPDSNVYVYFRHTPSAQVMVVINAHKHAKELKLDRFTERLKNAPSNGMDIISGAQVGLKGSLKLEPESAMIIEMPTVAR